MTERPAWGSPFEPGALNELDAIPGLDELTADWAWGGSSGQGIRVAVIDSGIDATRIELGRGVQFRAAFSDGPEGVVVSEDEHTDVFGHGTACAGIIRGLAPRCDLMSVRVLGPRLRGRGDLFIAGLRWAIEHGANVCNLSLGTTKKDHAAELYELADFAYFRGVVLVTAANNMPVESYPSLFSAAISVAAHGEGPEAGHYYNSRPPVEFGAPGIDVPVLWPGGSVRATGNSYAAPFITGRIAQILSKHPGLTVFQVKTILRAVASNVRAGKD